MHSYEVRGTLLLPSTYPFHQPYLSFSLPPELYSFDNLSSLQLHNAYLPVWTPSVTANQIVEMTPQYVEKHIILKENAKLDGVTSMVNKISH